MWWWFAGCFHAGLHVRPGEVLPPGEVALEADGTPVTLAPGSVRRGDDELHATFGARQMLHPIMALFVPPYSVGGGVRVGLAPGFEWVADLASQEASTGLRVALADHLALSASGGVYPSWFPLTANPRSTLTVDASVHQLRVQLGASLGQQVYVGFAPARWTTDCGSFGQAGCGEYSPGPAITARRTEVRALGALGVAIPVRDGEDGPSAVHLALAPWVTIATPGTTSVGMDRGIGMVRDFQATAGGSVLVGLAWGPFSTKRDRVWLEDDRLRGPPGGEGPWTEVREDGGTDVGGWRHGRRHGAFASRDADGTLRWERSYRRGKLHGWARQWYADGTVEAEGGYRGGRPVGPWRGFYENGRLRYEGTHRSSGQGPWCSWDEEGRETECRE